MELRKRLDFRKVFGVIYAAVFAMYIIVGLTPAEATNYEISAELAIPSVGLESGVTSLRLADGGLETPETIVGSFRRSPNKTLLIGHAATVFGELKNVTVGDEIIYDETSYRVVEVETLAKDVVDMNRLLKAEEQDTLVLMTCAGEMLSEGDATHRLIVTATR